MAEKAFVSPVSGPSSLPGQSTASIEMEIVHALSTEPQKPPKTVGENESKAKVALDMATKKFKDSYRTFAGHLAMDSKQAFREVRRGKIQYCIACSSVFLVVTLVTILMTGEDIPLACFYLLVQL
jgi:hypothetical protein